MTVQVPLGGLDGHVESSSPCLRGAAREARAARHQPRSRLPCALVNVRHGQYLNPVPKLCPPTLLTDSAPGVTPQGSRGVVACPEWFCAHPHSASHSACFPRAPALSASFACVQVSTDGIFYIFAVATVNARVLQRATSRLRRTPHAAHCTPHTARRTPHAARRTPHAARRTLHAAIDERGLQPRAVQRAAGAH